MDNQYKNVIIYSHGFAVRKTARGLFTSIANNMLHAKNIMFDYNPINESANTITVMTLDDQALKLRKIINTARAEFPDATIDLVCHSQGCVVAALLKPRHIRKIIMISPPDDMTIETVSKQIGRNASEPIDTSIKTRLARTDGSTTVIHPEYWQSLASKNAVKLYNIMARFTQLRLISAKQDDVLGETKMEGLEPTISSVRINGNHNFDDKKDRDQLVHILKKELQ